MKLELLKLLTAQASQYELQDSVWESLKPSDISHILGLMAIRGDGKQLHHLSHNQAAVWLGEVMYLDDGSHFVHLIHHIGQHLVKNCKITRGLDRVLQLTRHAINVFVDPKLCSACGGSGRLPLDGVIGFVSCQHCNESGRAPAPSQNKIADSLNIDRSRFHRTWAAVYEEAEYKLDRLHDTLVAVFARRLGYAHQHEGEAHQARAGTVAKMPENKGLTTV